MPDKDDCDGDFSNVSFKINHDVGTKIHDTGSS